MSVKNYRIGIIGGMGPQASIRLHQLILAAYADQLGAKDTQDYPLLVNISLPVIDFINDPSAIDKNSELFRLAAKLLTLSDVHICIIACNSAHIVTDGNMALRNLPVISLPESVVLEAAKRGVKKLGLLASPTSIRTKLYEKYTQAVGIQLLIDELLCDDLEVIIRRTIAGKAGAREVGVLNRLAEKLTEQGAEAIALGCTELSVISHLSSQKLPYIDSLTAATAALVAQVKSGRMDTF